MLGHPRPAVAVLVCPSRCEELRTWPLFLVTRDELEVEVVEGARVLGHPRPAVSMLVRPSRCKELRTWPLLLVAPVELFVVERTSKEVVLFKVACEEAIFERGAGEQIGGVDFRGARS